MCKILSWSDNHFICKNKINISETWLMSSYTRGRIGPRGLCSEAVMTLLLYTLHSKLLLWEDEPANNIETNRWLTLSPSLCTSAKIINDKVEYRLYLELITNNAYLALTGVCITAVIWHHYQPLNQWQKGFQIKVTLLLANQSSTASDHSK